jgi:hypothetical protein
VSTVSTVLHLPGDGEDDTGLELVELDGGAGLWGGSRPGRPDAYGTAAEVISALSDRAPADPWVREAAAALARERGWGFDGWRRPIVEVVTGSSAVFHATAVANRDSIHRHGLDWRRMGAAPGIAGSTRPELPGIFICDGMEDISFFLRMARCATDVWSVDAGGLWRETGPSGWWVISQPIGPERLRLVARDIPAHWDGEPPS